MLKPLLDIAPGWRHPVLGVQREGLWRKAAEPSAKAKLSNGFNACSACHGGANCLNRPRNLPP